MLTKKHYIKIAEIINRAYKSEGITISIESLIDDFSDWFKVDNANFNKTKFKSACLKGD